MIPRHFILALALIASQTQALRPQIPISVSNDQLYGPNIDSARKNANLIFNALHSSMRQWGNSLQHNGLSLYPATIPNGTLLYHGAPDLNIPSAYEWLAFEIEHAEYFAVAWKAVNQRRQSRQEGLPLIAAMTESNASYTQEHKLLPGYLQVYQANRPLNVLYIDGSSAANSPFGTLDTQDLIILDKQRPPMKDFERAEDLCTLGAEWGIEGFIRMEAGFELIKCNFSDGLDYISHNKRPAREDSSSSKDMFFIEYMRDVASRYHGIGARRVILDYSSMISVFFYPANLSSEASGNYDLSLPRIVYTKHEQLLRIRSDLKESMSPQKPLHESVDWQGVVDMIVLRFSDRLTLLEADLPRSTILSEISNLVNMYIDFANEPPDITASIHSCSVHYLQPVVLLTKQDHLIYEAIKTVTHRICTTLFQAREHLLTCTSTCEGISAVPSMILELKEWLNWTTWKRCPPCQQNAICYIAAFPWGLSEDHYSPSCLNYTEINKRNDVLGYWFPNHRRE